MFCRKCGKELNENAIYCDQCGAKVVEEEVIDVEVIDVTNQQPTVVDACKEPKGPWRAFAIIGYVLGIVDLVLLLVPFFSCIVSVFGIVLSALGKKSINKRRFARTGLTCNIIACAVNYVWTIIFFAALAG